MRRDHDPFSKVNDAEHRPLADAVAKSTTSNLDAAFAQCTTPDQRRAVLSGALAAICDAWWRERPKDVDLLEGMQRLNTVTDIYLVQFAALEQAKLEEEASHGSEGRA